MASAGSDVGGSCPIGNISKWRNRHRFSIGGELAFVDGGDDRAEQALDNKKEALKEPKAVDR
jgi:hypothetical protein